ncbi:MAG: polysaccharide deacetylase family protein [Chloroflexota bacterium]|jgi:peptidoglycan/xylan/chitin deacetylase (PgdA/CDA1 family)
MTGKFGRAGAWLLTLLVMAAIVIGLAISVVRVDESPAATTAPTAKPSTPEVASPQAVAALAQEPSPTALLETATAVPTATETPTTTPTTLPTTTPTEPAAGEPPTIPTATATPLPLPTPRDVYSWTLEVPILMYHYISQPPQGADKYRLDLSTSPALFREQMAYLLENGYETVDLYDLTLAIVDKGQLPAKPVVLTFDDGYRDNYENAFPILRELGLRGTFFVTTEFIDQNNPDYMSWAMIEEMAAAGMRIEPHSKTHPDLTLNDRDFIIWEVLGSQETIASYIGYRPRYFAYPGGRYNSEVQQIVAELDFWGAVTTTNGNWHGFDDRFEWGRVRMRNTTSPAELGDLIN